jgi:hypothetical protein
MPNPNLELLELAAERLRQLLPEIVFVGGCATGFMIDDPAAAPVRGTYDVEVIAEIGSYAEYTVFSERLHALGFKEDSREGAALCWWIHGALTLDVMPLDPQVLGFSNRWYPESTRIPSQAASGGFTTMGPESGTERRSVATRMRSSCTSRARPM